jgi:uncharacterized membrane protein (DUF106 family)
MISKLVKNLNNFAKTANSPKGILHNSKLLYALFIISLFNLVVFMSEKDYTSISTFLLVGILLSFFSKNMLIIILVALVVTNLLKYATNLNEGMEGMEEEEIEDEEKEGMEDEKEGNEEEKEGMAEDEDDKEVEENDE